MQVDEAKKIIQAIDSKDHMTIMQKEGIVLGGEHYMFMRNGVVVVVMMMIMIMMMMMMMMMMRRRRRRRIFLR